jgi:hypothetical protein
VDDGVLRIPDSLGGLVDEIVKHAKWRIKIAGISGSDFRQDPITFYVETRRRHFLKRTCIEIELITADEFLYCLKPEAHADLIDGEKNNAYSNRGKRIWSYDRPGFNNKRHSVPEIRAKTTT